MKHKPSPLAKGLLAADDPYEAAGQTPLEQALAKKRKRLALDKIGHLSDEDKERLGVQNGG